jgi:C-5 cytosine-specific DNA methylase
MNPLGIDLYCGLGGWTEGFLAEGYDVIGFDTERHVYGDQHYPAQLVLQDVRTIHGRQFKDAAVIVGSSPCQEFSWRAMPWSAAKQAPPPYLGIELFKAQFRIQREACQAAGRYIPMVVENVCGAQKWVGRARWLYGSYYLWGDVPALMPMALKGGVKVGGLDWKHPDHPRHRPGQDFNTTAEQRIKEAGLKEGGRWFTKYGPGNTNPIRRTGSRTKGPQRRLRQRLARSP